MMKKVILVATASMLALNSTATASQVYAYDSNTTQTDRQTNRMVYVKTGYGSEAAGTGSYDNPYLNIQTALDNIQDGETLVIIGTVQYTKYKTHTDGSALPLYIDKDITIEGADANSGLSVRTTIQLGANVTFRNMELELVPETILGRSNENTNGRLGFGQLVERSSTIYVAGHTLTLDNVRPDSSDIHQLCISGGAYKGTGNIGSKSVINLVNQNKSENTIHAIYAGDYYTNRTMNVEINIHGRLSDTEIHAADDNYLLIGNVDVNIYNGSNVTGFDRTNHMGNLNVTLKQDYFNTVLSLNNVDSLTLEDNAKMTLLKGKQFNVGQVTLNSSSTIDFSNMGSNPIVNGDFISNGTIILGSEQTLNVGGEVIGTTKLNQGLGYLPMLYNGNQYIIAGTSSNGDFVIDEEYYYDIFLEKTNSGDKTIWAATNSPKSPSETFKGYQWVGGEDVIVNPEVGAEYRYPVKLINEEGNEFKPDVTWDFNLALTRDGAELPEGAVYFAWDEDKNTLDVADINEVMIVFDNPTEAYGELLLTVTHIDSGLSTSRIINVLEEELPEDEEEPGADIPVTLPDDVPVQDVKPETDIDTDMGVDTDKIPSKPMDPEDDLDSDMNVDVDSLPSKPDTNIPDEDFDSGMNVDPNEIPNKPIEPDNDLDSDMEIFPEDIPVTLPDDVPVDTTDTPTILPDDVPVDADDTPTILPDDVPVQDVKPETDIDNEMNVKPEQENPDSDFDSDMEVFPEDEPVTLPDDVPVDTDDIPTILPDDYPVDADDIPTTLPDDYPVDTDDTPTILPDDYPVDTDDVPTTLPDDVPVESVKPGTMPGEDFDSDMNVMPEDEPTILPDDVPVDTTDTPTVLPDDVPVDADDIPTILPDDVPVDTTDAPTTLPDDVPVDTDDKPTILPDDIPVEDNLPPTEYPVAPPITTPPVVDTPVETPIVPPVDESTEDEPVEEPSITLNKTSATIYTKGSTTTQLTATVVGKSKKVKYTSSNTRVATVDSSGRVRSIKAGTTTITAEANGLTVTCTITVKKPTLKVGKTKLTVKRGEKTVISVKATPAKDITFTSSNEKVATVNSNGVVTAKKRGTAKITIRCNGITKKVTIKVKK